MQSGTVAANCIIFCFLHFFVWFLLKSSHGVVPILPPPSLSNIKRWSALELIHVGLQRIRLKDLAIKNTARRVKMIIKKVLEEGALMFLNIGKETKCSFLKTYCRTFE